MQQKFSGIAKRADGFRQAVRTGVCAADGNVGGCRGFPAPVWLTGFVDC